MAGIAEVLVEFDLEVAGVGESQAEFLGRARAVGDVDFAGLTVEAGEGLEIIDRGVGHRRRGAGRGQCLAGRVEFDGEGVARLVGDDPGQAVQQGRVGAGDAGDRDHVASRKAVCGGGEDRRVADDDRGDRLGAAGSGGDLQGRALRGKCS